MKPYKWVLSGIIALFIETIGAIFRQQLILFTGFVLLLLISGIRLSKKYQEKAHSK